MIYDKKSFERGNIEDSGIHEKIIDALPIPIFYRDVNGIYQLCNKAHEKFTGRPKEEIIGKSIHEIHSKETADTYAGQDKELLKSQGVQVYETQIKHNVHLVNHQLLL